MKACWYERAGPPEGVLEYGDIPPAEPGPGELRLRVHASGVNPGDVKKRQDAFALGLPFPRIIPHSDGAGIVESVGPGVTASWIGARVWGFGAQTYRPFGTAAEFCCLPVENVVRLPDHVTFEQGALLGIPGLTAHEAVHAAGPVSRKTVLVQGGAGAVGSIAVFLAKRAGANVIASVRKPVDEATARRAGADHVVLGGASFVEQVLQAAPHGVDHIIEVAFGANIEDDVEILAPAGSIAAYASDRDAPTLPFWPLVFKNVRLYFLGSDDFPTERKRQAAVELTAAASEGWVGLPIVETYDLSQVAEAHARVELGGAGRVVIKVE